MKFEGFFNERFYKLLENSFIELEKEPVRNICRFSTKAILNICNKELDSIYDSGLSCERILNEESSYYDVKAPKDYVRIYEMNAYVTNVFLNMLGDMNIKKRSKNNIRRITSQEEDNNLSEFENYSRMYVLCGQFEKNGPMKILNFSDPKSETYYTKATNIQPQVHTTRIPDKWAQLVKRLNSREFIELGPRIKAELIKMFDGDKKAIKMIKRNEFYSKYYYDMPLADAIIKMIREHKKIETLRYCKCLTLDIDQEEYENLKRDFIFEKLKMIRNIIVKNKYNNHMTVYLFFDEFRNYEDITRVRNMFKLLGLTDKNHRTVHGKNIFNTYDFDIYTNMIELGGTCSNYISEESLKPLINCVNIQERMFKQIEQNVDNNIVAMTDLTFSAKNEKIVEVKPVYIWETEEYVNFAKSRGYKTELTKKRTFGDYFKVLSKKEYLQKVNTFAENFTKFESNLKESKITNRKELFEIDQIVLQNENRIKYIRKISYLLGSNVLLGLSLDETKKFINQKVTIIDPEQKHSKQKIDKNIEEAYNDGKTRMYEYIKLNGKYTTPQRRLGNLRSIYKRSVKSLFNRFDFIINEYKKRTKFEDCKKRAYRKWKKNRYQTDQLLELVYHRRFATEKDFVNALSAILENWLQCNIEENNIKKCFKDGVTQCGITISKELILKYADTIICLIDKDIFISKVKEVAETFVDTYKPWFVRVMLDRRIKVSELRC